MSSWWPLRLPSLSLWVMRECDDHPMIDVDYCTARAGQLCTALCRTQKTMNNPQRTRLNVSLGCPSCCYAQSLCSLQRFTMHRTLCRPHSVKLTVHKNESSRRCSEQSWDCSAAPLVQMLVDSLVDYQQTGQSVQSKNKVSISFSPFWNNNSEFCLPHTPSTKAPKSSTPCTLKRMHW